MLCRLYLLWFNLKHRYSCFSSKSVILDGLNVRRA